MRADRLLSILMLLQSNGKMTAAELARELEVSERTIYRDVIALGTSGVPVFTEPGPGGGISLLERYRSDLTGLTQDEVQALFMLSIPAALSDLGLDRRLKEALYKLSAALPATLRDHQRQVRQRIHIDSDGWQVPGESTPHLLTLQQAIWSDQVLEVKYQTRLGSRFGLLSAKIEPYGLVAKAGKWYLVALRVDHMAVIQVDLITDVRVFTKGYERAPEFDLVSFWQDWCVDNQDRLPTFEVVVEMASALRPFLSMIMGDATIFELGSNAEADEQGWSLWRLQFTSFEEARGRILSMGGAVKVLEPRALRLSVMDFARQTIAANDQ